jgi:hypothetical protein
VGIVATRSRIIPVSVSSSSNRNDFRPRLLTGEAAARVNDHVRTLSKALAAEAVTAPEGR